jgi:hypothetical protein
MKRSIVGGVSLLLLCGLAANVHGNGAVPFPPRFGPNPGVFQPPAPQPQKATLVVEVDARAKETRLVIPVKFALQGLIPPGVQPGQPGALPGQPGGFPGQPGLVPPGGFQPGIQPGNPFPAPTPPPVTPRIPRRGADAGKQGVTTVVVALALTLAFATGGFWVVRRGGSRYLAILLVLSVLALGTAALWADIGPRPAPRPRPVPPQPQPAQVELPKLHLPSGVVLPSKITVEIVPQGDEIRLIVPKAAVVKKGAVKPADADE